MSFSDLLFLCFPVRVATPTTATQPPSRDWSQVRNHLWQRCLCVLSGNQEPQVWPESDRYGHTIAWHVYDPASGCRSCFGTELEVRLWLEQQYHH